MFSECSKGKNTLVIHGKTIFYFGGVTDGKERVTNAQNLCSVFWIKSDWYRL